jgi:hypothetical protein
VKYTITKSTGQYEKDELEFEIPDDAGDDTIIGLITAMHRIMDTARQERQAEQPPAPPQMRDPDAPASEKQRSYMEYLLKELHWSNDQLVSFARDRNRNILTLTKREASELIDELKQVLTGDRPAAQDTIDAASAGRPQGDEPGLFDEPKQAILPTGERATQRQIRALERLAGERGIDLGGELDQHFGGRGLDALSMDEAGQLLSEWQQRPRKVMKRS